MTSPAGTPLFDADFRRLLRDIVARVRQIRAREDESAHARRRVRGATGSFAGHQPYSTGDDLRRVDWNAYARSGELFVKLFEEEERRAITVMLDGSASMQAGDEPRFDGARRLVALLGALALARLGGMRLYGADGEVRAYSRLGELDRLLEDLSAMRADAVDQSALLEGLVGRLGVGRSARQRGRILWLSDFSRLDEVRHGLRRLLPLRGQLLGVWTRIPADDGPPLDGRVELQDHESGERLVLRVDRALQTAMQQELERLERQRADVFVRAGVPLLAVALPGRDDTRAGSWLRGGWLARI